jgi:hypothetical protein
VSSVSEENSFEWVLRAASLAIPVETTVVRVEHSTFVTNGPAFETVYKPDI